MALQQVLATEPADTNSETTAAWKVIDDSIRDGSSQEHREQALAAISTFGDSNAEAIQRAVMALHDKDAVIRRSAAISLGALKAHSALGDLKQALNDTPEVSFAAAKALTELGDTSGRDVMIAVLAGERKDSLNFVVELSQDAASFFWIRFALTKPEARVEIENCPSPKTRSQLFYSIKSITSISSQKPPCSNSIRERLIHWPILTFISCAGNVD